MKLVLQRIARAIANRFKRRAKRPAGKRTVARSFGEHNAAKRLVAGYYTSRRPFEPKRPHLVRSVVTATDRDGKPHKYLHTIDQSKYPAAKLRELRADRVHR